MKVVITKELLEEFKAVGEELKKVDVEIANQSEVDAWLEYNQFYTDTIGALIGFAVAKDIYNK